MSKLNYSVEAVWMRYLGLIVLLLPTLLLADNENITLFWDDMSETESGYVVERSTTSETEGFEEIFVTEANVETFQDLDVAVGQSYWYRVKATNAAGDSEYSNVYGTVAELRPPNPPGNLRGPAQVTINNGGNSFFSLNVVNNAPVDVSK